MTSGQVQRAVRHEIKDEDEGRYRWDDVAVYRAIVDALRRVHMTRSDLFLADDGLTMNVVPDEITTNNVTMPVPATLLMTLVRLACAVLLASDGEDDANLTRADGYMKTALNDLLGNAG